MDEASHIMSRWVDGETDRATSPISSPPGRFNADHRPCAQRRTGNPNHHLWNNHGVWFLHHTIYPTPWTKERRRFSLKTRSLNEARRRRDEYFGLLGATGDVAWAQPGGVRVVEPTEGDSARSLRSIVSDRDVIEPGACVDLGPDRQGMNAASRSSPKGT